MRVHQNTWGRVSQAQKRDWKRDEEVQSLCNIWGFWCGYQLICRWTMVVPMYMYNSFPAGRLEQMIMTSLYDIMRISHAVKGGNYKRRAGLNPGATIVTVFWMFWYKAFGLANKPQTLYLGCLGAPQRGSITRMDSATYLSICTLPDLSGGRLVSATLVVWWQLGRSLPSPLEPGIEWSMDHNPLVANCKGGINC